MCDREGRIRVEGSGMEKGGKAWNNLLKRGCDTGDSSRARGVVRRAGAACNCQLVASNGMTLSYQDGLQLMSLLEII